MSCSGQGSSSGNPNRLNHPQPTYQSRIECLVCNTPFYNFDALLSHYEIHINSGVCLSLLANESSVQNLWRMNIVPSMPLHNINFVISYFRFQIENFRMALAPSLSQSIQNPATFQAPREQNSRSILQQQQQQGQQLLHSNVRPHIPISQPSQSFSRASNIELGCMRPRVLTQPYQSLPLASNLVRVPAAQQNQSVPRASNLDQVNLRPHVPTAQPNPSLLRASNVDHVNMMRPRVPNVQPTQSGYGSLNLDLVMRPSVPLAQQYRPALGASSLDHLNLRARVPNTLPVHPLLRDSNFDLANIRARAPVAPLNQPIVGAWRFGQTYSAQPNQVAIWPLDIGHVGMRRSAVPAHQNQPIRAPNINYDEDDNSSDDSVDLELTLG